MKILRFVSFAAPFGKTDARTFEERGILDAARTVAAGLRAAGIRHSEPSNRGDWAYDLTAQQDAQTIELIVASTDEDRPFVVSIEGMAGFLAGKAKKDALVAVHRTVCQAIHNELSRTPDLTKVRWWTEAQWEAESGWTEEP
jgi:hypothetical protein